MVYSAYKFPRYLSKSTLSFFLGLMVESWLNQVMIQFHNVFVRDLILFII